MACCQGSSNSKCEDKSSNSSSKNVKPITKDMPIGDIVARYPQVASVVQAYGLHCVGCHVSAFETLEEGALGHGMSEEDVENMVRDMNKVISQSNNSGSGRNKGGSSGGIDLTKSAVDKLKDLMKKENKDGFALRVSVVPGGCSGFSYELTFVQKGEREDLSLEKHGLQVYVDKDSLEFINGASIDYVDTLQESGFKINNPNITSSCGCGKSFS